MKEFTITDWIIFFGYVTVIVFIGLWVSRVKKGKERTAQDYFLAGRTLPWWIIGTTLIAANISAEHFIAMSGSGYAIGLAIAAYEWIAAVSLIFVAKYFLPVFIEKGTLFAPDGKGGIKDAFSDLPGLGVVLGSMWLTNLSFWGFNQFIIQRSLAGKSLKEAQLGVAFAGYLKLLVPLLVVIPGIAVFALGAKLGKSDEAYPWLIQNIVPVGVRGLSCAAIAAAAVSALSSILNSTSTVFTIDIYKGFIKKNATEKQMVRVGMAAALIALMISTIIAPQLRTLDQAYQYIQEYTGFIYPGEFLIFFCGLFWRQASAKAALSTALLTIPMGLLMKMLFPSLPFVLRIGYVFIILSFVMVGISLLDKDQKTENLIDQSSAPTAIKLGRRFVAVALFLGMVVGFFVYPMRNLALEAIYVPITGFILIGLILIFNNKIKIRDNKSIVLKKGIFKTTAGFNIAAMGICGILAALYFFFW